MREKKQRPFPNLAGHSDPDPVLGRELVEAGILNRWIPFPVAGEVSVHVVGELGPWGFVRAWYYWVAEGPGIPPADAERLHETWGRVVRVDGHCGCPSPREWHRGFAVGCYHVDTQEGLNALAALIRDILARNEEEER